MKIQRLSYVSLFLVSCAITSISRAATVTVTGSNRDSYCNTALERCVSDAQIDCGDDTECQTSEVQTCKKLYGDSCKKRSGGEGGNGDKVKINVNQANIPAAESLKADKAVSGKNNPVYQQCRELKNGNWLCERGKTRYLCNSKKQDCRIYHK